MKKVFCIALLLFLSSCTMKQQKDVDGCFVRTVDISTISSLMGNSYGKDAQGKEFVCLQGNDIMRGIFIYSLENKYIEDAYSFYDEEYEKQLALYEENGGDSSNFYFDESLLFQRLDEKNYQYAYHEVERMVGTIDRNNGYYLYYGRMLAFEKFLESVMGKGTLSIKDDLLTMNQVEGIVGYYRHSGKLGKYEFTRIDMKKYIDKEILIEGFSDDDYIVYSMPIKDYFIIDDKYKSMFKNKLEKEI